MSLARTRATPDEGLLDKISVPEILAKAWSARRTGRLRLARAKSECWIQVVDGSPVAVESKDEGNQLARVLESTGQIQLTDRRKLEQFAVERACSQASAALALKLVDSASLYQAIRAEARQRMAETFEWQSGAYQWSPDPGKTPPNAKPYDILVLIQSQLPKHWGSERLFAAVMSISQSCADIAPRLRRVAVKLAGAGPIAAQVVQRLDGSVPVGRILGEAAGDPLAAATIFTLLHAGILRIGDPGVVVARGSGLEFEVEIAPDARAASAGRTAQAHEARGLAPATALDPETEGLRRDIESLAGKLGKLDHYAVLGLDPGAQTGRDQEGLLQGRQALPPGCPRAQRPRGPRGEGSTCLRPRVGSVRDPQQSRQEGRPRSGREQRARDRYGAPRPGRDLVPKG